MAKYNKYMHIYYIYQIITYIQYASIKTLRFVFVERSFYGVSVCVSF